MIAYKNDGIISKKRCTFKFATIKRINNKTY